MHDEKFLSHLLYDLFRVACNGSRIAAASCPSVSFSCCTCLHGCCCSISAVKAVRKCGFVLLPRSCSQLSHHSAVQKRGHTAVPPFSFLFFFTSSLPPIFSFTCSRSQRQTQARQGNWVNLQLLNSCVPVETAGQMGPTSTQTQTKAFTSIRDLSPTCILMR